MTKIFNAMIIFVIALINFFIIIFPEQILLASKNGIVLWFNNILPTILPFLICANILIFSGFLEILSIFLESISQKFFNLPGIFIFVFISGIISGYPVGSKLVVNLRKDKKITREQANTLIMFCNNPGILFILGTVATSMLKNKYIGYFLILTNYLTVLLIVFIFGFLSRINNKKEKKFFTKEKFLFKFKRTFKKLMSNKKSIGYILSKSVSDAIESMLQICGFIVLFSVIVKILELIKLCELIYGFKPDFLLPNLDFNKFKGIFISLFELTNGVKILCLNKLSKNLASILALVISFGGLSVHAQTFSLMSNTDISKKRYLISKIIISLVVFLFSYIFYNFFN
ncbi:MAG: hypothetical protein LBJ93_02345 [Clostridiales bacterium]|jgi:sporulation integral membrane protein YlbJ|nr:hypothetical protein [Clostridiales bacterium]